MKQIIKAKTILLNRERINLSAIIAGLCLSATVPCQAVVSSAFSAGTLTVSANANNDDVTLSHDGTNVLVNALVVSGGTGVGGNVILNDLTVGILLQGDADNDQNIFLVDETNGLFQTTSLTPILITLNGGGGDDVLISGSNVETLTGGLGNDLIFGSNGNDILAGSTGDDLIDGGIGNDTIQSGGGVDTLFGSAGDDTFEVGSGMVNVDGETGADSLTLATATQPVTLNVNSFDAFQTASATLSLSLEEQLETITFTPFGDTVAATPSSTVRTLNGGNGTDTLNYNPAPQTATLSGTTILTPTFANINTSSFENLNLLNNASINDWLNF